MSVTEAAIEGQFECILGPFWNQMLAVGCVGLQGSMDAIACAARADKFCFEQSQCEPYRPYRDIRIEERV